MSQPPLIADGPVGAHDVDDLEVVAQADLPVVGIVRRSDLQETGGVAGLGVGAVGVGHDDVVVGDDRDHPIDDGQTHHRSDQLLGARIVRVEGDGGVAEHRLGAGGGHRDVARAVGQRIAQVPHVPVDLGHLDLVVGQRRTGHRDPS